MAIPAGLSRNEWARQRYELVAHLISHHLREGIIDPENGLEIGTYQWFAAQVVKKMGKEIFPNGEPVLPKGYFAGGEIAAMTFGRDYHRIRQKTKSTLAENMEAVRAFKTHQLEHLSEKLYRRILKYDAEGNIDASLGLVDQFLQVTDRIVKINGISVPARTVQANVNIDFSKLTRAQLDRLAGGEAPEQVLALSAGDIEEEEILEAEYADAE